MVEKFSYLGISNSINPKKFTPRERVDKLLKTKDDEKLLESSRTETFTLTYIGEKQLECQCISHQKP